jgi:hypothetical protein
MARVEEGCLLPFVRTARVIQFSPHSCLEALGA